MLITVNPGTQTVSPDPVPAGTSQAPADLGSQAVAAATPVPILIGASPVQQYLASPYMPWITSGALGLLLGYLWGSD